MSETKTDEGLEPSISEFKLLVKINYTMRFNEYVGFSAKQRDTLINLVRRESIVRGFADESEAELYYSVEWT